MHVEDGQAKPKGGKMKFVFNERRAAQAAAHLLKLYGGKTSVIALIKLLYLADKESLIHTGRPITGDRPVSMDNGPVLSIIYDFIKKDRLSQTWSEYVSDRRNHEVCLVKDEPETDELSEYELRVLDGVFRKHGATEKWALVKWCHEELPEWEDPEGSSIPIDLETILRYAGKTDAEINRLCSEADELRELAQLERKVS